MWWWASRLALGLALVSSAACGYSLAGRGSFLPDYVKTIAIPLFANNTKVFEIEQRLTEAVRREFIGRGKYKIVPEAAGADAQLTGAIQAIALTPTAFDENRQATRYVAVIVIRVELRDLKADKVLWENPSLEFREEFEPQTFTTAGAGTGGSPDASAFFGQASNALDRMTANFARTVVSTILEAF